MTDEDFEAGIAALNKAIEELEAERRKGEEEERREVEAIVQELASDGNPFASEFAPRDDGPFNGYPGGFSLS